MDPYRIDLDNPEQFLVHEGTIARFNELSVFEDAEHPVHAVTWALKTYGDDLAEHDMDIDGAFYETLDDYDKAYGCLGEVSALYKKIYHEVKKNFRYDVNTRQDAVWLTDALEYAMENGIDAVTDSFTNAESQDIMQTINRLWEHVIDRTDAPGFDPYTELNIDPERFEGETFELTADHVEQSDDIDINHPDPSDFVGETFEVTGISMMVQYDGTKPAVRLFAQCQDRLDHNLSIPARDVFDSLQLSYDPVEQTRGLDR